MIVVAICSIQCIWISVSPCPQNVDNGNVMGVIERKPPSSFSRRSSSGNGGFEHYHPPVQSFPFASRTLHPTSTLRPYSRDPSRSSPFISPSSFATPPLSSFFYDFRLSRTSSRIIYHSSPLPSMSLPPLCFLLSATAYPQRIRRYTHGRFPTLPLPPPSFASSDPRVSSPRRASPSASVFFSVTSPSFLLLLILLLVAATPLFSTYFPFPSQY